MRPSVGSSDKGRDARTHGLSCFGVEGPHLSPLFAINNALESMTMCGHDLEWSPSPRQAPQGSHTFTHTMVNTRVNRCVQRTGVRARGANEQEREAGLTTLGADANARRAQPEAERGSWLSWRELGSLRQTRGLKSFLKKEKEASLRALTP